MTIQPPIQPVLQGTIGECDVCRGENITVYPYGQLELCRHCIDFALPTEVI